MGWWDNGGNMALLDIIIILACIQVFILIFLVITSFFVKLHLEKLIPIKQKRRALFKTALINYPDISSATLIELKKNLHMTFVVLLEIENELPEKIDIIKSIFLEQIQYRAKAPLWYDRYMAAVLLQLVHRYGVDYPTDDIIISLLHDPVILISINALKALAIKPNERLFDEATLVFSKWRRSPLELMVFVLKEANFKYPKMLIKKLKTESSPIIRTFYYRVLIDLPLIQMKMPYLIEDIHHPSLDLALAALTYLNFSKKPFYQQHLQEALCDERWQIRARALKYLARTQDEQYVDTISMFLNDKVWWVRFRAAKGLSILGIKGQQALEKAKVGLDQFAQDISSLRLEHMSITKDTQP